MAIRDLLWQQRKKGFIVFLFITFLLFESLTSTTCQLQLTRIQIKYDQYVPWLEEGIENRVVVCGVFVLFEARDLTVRQEPFVVVEEHSYQIYAVSELFSRSKQVEIRNCVCNSRPLLCSLNHLVKMSPEKVQTSSHLMTCPDMFSIFLIFTLLCHRSTSSYS